MKERCNYGYQTIQRFYRPSRLAADQCLDTEFRAKAAENGSSVPSLEFYSIKIDPINMEEHLEVIQNLNQRQVWFYFQIQQGHLVTARDLVEVWQVDLRREAIP